MKFYRLPALSAARTADKGYLFLSLICVVLFILGESVIIYYMMKSLGAKVKIGHCALYSFVGFFFSCITPSATGGQPMQIYYMKKDKLPIPVTTLVLMLSLRPIFLCWIFLQLYYTFCYRRTAYADLLYEKG